MNDHYFVNIFSFGIFTTTSQRTPDKRKHQIGKLAYLIEGVKEFRSVHGIPLQILADGKAFDLESLMALIFNGETAGGFHLAPRSSIKDGMFDCLLLQRRNMLFSVVSMLRHLLGGRPSQVNISEPARSTSPRRSTNLPTWTDRRGPISRCTSNVCTTSSASSARCRRHPAGAGSPISRI